MCLLVGILHINSYCIVALLPEDGANHEIMQQEAANEEVDIVKRAVADADRFLD